MKPTKIEQIVVNFFVRFNPRDVSNLMKRIEVRRIQEKLNY